MNQARRSLLPLVAARPAGNPSSPAVAVDAPATTLAPVSVSAPATPPSATDVEIVQRVRRARGPLGGSGPHSFGLVLRDPPVGLRVFARVLAAEGGTVREVRVALPLREVSFEGRPMPFVAVHPTAIAVEVEAPMSTTVTIPWEAMVPIPDGSDMAVVDLGHVASFWTRHKHHILLGAAVAGAVGLAVWASGPRANPACGPLCGCAPCRRARRPTPADGRRVGQRGSRR